MKKSHDDVHRIAKNLPQNTITTRLPMSRKISMPESQVLTGPDGVFLRSGLPGGGACFRCWGVCTVASGVERKDGEDAIEKNDDLEELSVERIDAVFRSSSSVESDPFCDDGWLESFLLLLLRF
ncbi:hypothetical protein B296_00035809 [Ensete ventricosum]|uniref:Uncharacterized protein n=1 Tax=Ensete ventricosum TaxID=4639 RepID=A0A426YI86_ENSVE|nr:hypothetical protein B296_00035809 [Ensete ventricosum]